MKKKNSFFFALIVWVSITSLVLTSILFIGMRWGKTGFQTFIHQWVYTHQPTTLASVSMTWFLAGSLVYFLYVGKFNKSNILTWVGFYLVAFLYLNVLRERFRFGDISYYIEAATRLANGQSLPNTHFYMPLWATLIKFLLPWGEDGILMFLGIFNIISICVFYFLVHRVLNHYGFSPNLAAIVTTLFMLVNTPIIRVLMYVQVNLHVMNAIFLSLLLYRKSPIVSALMLALAAQLKTSPLILVIAFLLEWNWHWLAWFIVSNLLFSSVTLLSDGIYPFLDVFNNLTTLVVQRPAVFHDNAFDSFFSFPSEVFGMSKSLVPLLVYGAKGILGIATLVVTYQFINTKPFFSNGKPGTRLYNAILPLFILMNMVCPVVWVHHGVFVTLSFLILLKQLETPTQWTWFGLAYLLEFIIPTFDFFPWSYGRMVAPLICLGLMWGLSDKPSALFTKLNEWMNLPFV